MKFDCYYNYMFCFNNSVSNQYNTTFWFQFLYNLDLPQVDAVDGGPSVSTAEPTVNGVNENTGSGVTTETVVDTGSHSVTKKPIDTGSKLMSVEKAKEMASKMEKVCMHILTFNLVSYLPKP